MKLELLQTVINPDTNYSEDTTIRVTAVRTDNGQVLTGFTGTVNIAEVGTAIYVQNIPPGTTLLPPSVSITSGGTATFVAKSLAGPKSANAKPDAATIQTTNYPVKGNNLDIPQWIISPTPIDPKAAGPVYDWVQKRAKDIDDNGNTDVKAVRDAIVSYSIAAESDPRVAGHTQGGVVSIDPYRNGSPISRLDSIFSGNCGTVALKDFTAVFLHEARHAYQYKLINTPGNNADSDTLPKSVSIAPTDILVDSTTPRTVCDQFAGTTHTRVYKGDSIPDAFNVDATAPNNPNVGWASYAWEMDSWVFSGIYAK